MNNKITDQYIEFKRIHGRLTFKLALRKMMSFFLHPFFGKPNYAKKGLYFYCKTRSDKYVFNEVWGDDSSYGHSGIVNHLKNGLIVDIGAHKGYFTLFASNYADRIISIEPMINNYKYLVRIRLVNLLYNVKTVNKAIGSFRGYANIYESSISDARHSVYHTKFVGTGKLQNIDQITIDDIMQKFTIEKIDLLKIDCEGCEYDILFHSDGWLNKVSSIVLEVHESPEIKYNKDHLRQYLEHKGFIVDFYFQRNFDDFNVCMAFCEKVQK